MSRSRARCLLRLAPLLMLSGLFAMASGGQTAPSPIAAGGDWRAAVRQFAAEQGNLRNVPPGILSRAGRAHSVVRVRELEQYLQELRLESDDLRAL
jgi:hypothetical protein